MSYVFLFLLKIEEIYRIQIINVIKVIYMYTILKIIVFLISDVSYIMEYAQFREEFHL